MTPYIIKESAPSLAALKAISKKTLPWVSSKVGVTSRLGSKFNSIANPHFVFPLVGAGIGASRSLKAQGKAMQEGSQQKFDWGKLGIGAGIGAGAGLGVSMVKPVGKAWKWGWTTKAMSPEAQQAMLSKNPIWASQRVNPPKFMRKEYFKGIYNDMTHPLQSIKAMGTDVKYGFNYDQAGKAILHKRSPFGMAASGVFNTVLPAKFLYDTAKDKDMSPAERAVRVGTIGLSYTTPKFVPSMLMMEAPGLFFKKKPPVSSDPYSEGSA